MSMVIAVNGKGGTGKTTVTALIVNALAAMKKGTLLAVDADPNFTLSNALGLAVEGTMVGVIDEVSAKKDALPSGMTKDRFIEMRVQESIAEGPGYDVLIMGRPEGPGCYCYVNNVLRGVIGSVSRNYDYLVIDNAAGMEHISRRTERVIDRLLLVSDFSIIGVRSCARIYNLAREMKIKIGAAFILLNKCVSERTAALEKEIALSGLTCAGEIASSEALARASVEDRPVREAVDEAVAKSVARIMETILAA